MSRSPVSRAVVALAAASCVLAACGGDRGTSTGMVGEREKAGGMAVVCYQNAPESLDAFVSSDLGAADLRLLLFTPLILYGESGSYRPYLATSWNWSPDRRSLVFEIRRDLTWHDGRPLTPEDVAFTLEIARQPEYAYPSADDFSDLREVMVRDSVRVELRFAQPQVEGLEQFVWLPILPRHLLADLGPDEFARADYHRSPVGSGPFAFRERRADGLIVLQRYEGFPEGLGAPYLDRIAIRSIVEPSAILVELANGGVDLCVTNAPLADRIEGADPLETIALEPPLVMVLPLNTNRPPLDDARVRRALSAGLDRSDIAAAVARVAEPVGNPLPKSSPWYEPGLLQPDDDSLLAVSLLDSAGWRTNGVVRTNESGEPLRFQLIAPPARQDALTVMQSQWRRIGVQVELRFMEYASYVGLLGQPEQRPDIMALTFAPAKVFVPSSELYSEFHSEGYFNLGSYVDRQVDSLIERLAAPIESDQRRRIYRDVQARIIEDVPMVFVISVPRLEIVGPRLKGVEADLNGPFVSVTNWWIGSRR